MRQDDDTLAQPVRASLVVLGSEVSPDCQSPEERVEVAAESPPLVEDFEAALEEAWADLTQSVDSADSADLMDVREVSAETEGEGPGEVEEEAGQVIEEEEEEEAEEEVFETEAPQELEQSELCASSFAAFEGEEEEEEEEVPQELYDRFEQLWDTPSGAKDSLSEFSGPFVQSMVAALEELADTCKLPSYVPYKPEEPLKYVLPRPPVVSTPSSDDEMDPEDLPPLPPPPVVRCRKRRIPLLILERERKAERIRQAQMRKPWSPPKKQGT